MSKFILCLDAGHHGKANRSPVNPDYYESVMTWDLHELVRDKLTRRGVEVRITRSDRDEPLEVTRRGRMARGCSLFVSLHSNAAMRGDEPITDRTHVSAIYQHALEASRDPALLIGEATCEAMGIQKLKAYPSKTYTKNGKVYDYYGVLRGSAMVGVPGLILECGFHTNYDTTVWLLDPANLNILASGIAGAICELAGVGLVPGDFDGDGVLSDADLEIEKMLVQGFIPVTPELLEIGDVDGDGRITIKDYTILRREQKKFAK